MGKLQVTPIPASLGDIDGGLVTTVTFTLKNGSTKSININNGNYRDKGGSYFDLSYVPKFNGSEEVTSTIKFTTFDGIVDIYSGEETVGNLPLSELEFVELDAGEAPPKTEKYTVKADVGVLIFTSDEIFYVKGADGVYYKLVNQSINDYIPIYDDGITD